jgi:hypothetical protein
MKSFLQLLAERVLSIPLSLEINKREREYTKGKNMYKTVKSLEDIGEPIENINIGNKIILCGRESENLIRQNIDGTFSLILNRDENLSMGKTALDGNMSVIEYNPFIKMCIPQGIKINFRDSSFGFSYVNKIYSTCKTYYPGEKEKDSSIVGFLDLPANYYLTDFRFTILIDVHVLRSHGKNFLIKKGEGIVNIDFTHLPHATQSLDNIIYIKNNEVFETFLNVF